MKNIERDIWNAHIRGKIITFNHRAINLPLLTNFVNNIEINICNNIGDNISRNIYESIKENIANEKHRS